MKNHNYFETDFSEIVFENRNKSYGAFAIRTHYNDHMSWSMGITFTALLVLFFSYQLLKNSVDDIIELKNIPVVFTPIPNLTPVIVQPIKPAPVAAEKPKTIKSETYRVVANTEVIKEEFKPSTVEDLKNSTVGNSTETGNGVLENNQTNGGTLEGTGLGTETTVPENIPVKFAENMPSYVGGPEKMMEFIRTKYRYPSYAKELGIEGQIVVSFVIGTDGQLTQPKIIRSLGYGCDEELIRVLQLMPKWIPGKHNGKLVPVVFSMPVKLFIHK